MAPCYNCINRLVISMDLLAKVQNLPQQQSKESVELAKEETGTETSDFDIRQLFGTIINGTMDEYNRQHDPEIIRTKNNLLLILLVLSAYGVYYLIGDFLDVLLIAYIAGIAYHQSRETFTQFVTNPHSYEGQTVPFTRRLIKAVIFLAIGFVFPRIRYLLTHPHKFRSFPTFWDFIGSIQKTNNYAVIVCQVLIGIYILHLLLGPFLKRIGRQIRPRSVKLVRVFFALLTLFILIGLILMVPTILFREMTNAGHLIQQKVQQKLGCEIISFRDDGNSSLPLCSQKITTENHFIRQTVQEFKEQNKTLEDCLIFLEKIQEQYLEEYVNRYEVISKNIYYYEEVICTWYSFLEKAVSYSGIVIQADSQDLHKVFSTGTSLFKLFFGNLAWVLSMISNSIFNITTFITTFLLTSKYYNNSSTIKELFSLNKQELISSITSLIQATLLIVIEHFVLSLLLLEIFQITPINLIIATLLASMAMFPFFRPWLGVLIVSLVRMLVLEDYYLSTTFVVIYYLMSQKIYSIHYRKMELHQIVTNMSVLFGIYRFGVVGVFYGPLIIITCQCVQKELFKKNIGKRDQM